MTRTSINMKQVVLERTESMLTKRTLHNSITATIEFPKTKISKTQPLLVFTP
jgi:hypothetical protein